MAQTRYSQQLPALHLSLSLLYVGRMLLGFQPAASAEVLKQVDDCLEKTADELAATELLHEAALLVGDCLPDSDALSLN